MTRDLRNSSFRGSFIFIVTIIFRDLDRLHLHLRQSRCNRAYSRTGRTNKSSSSGVLRLTIEFSNQYNKNVALSDSGSLK